MYFLSMSYSESEAKVLFFSSDQHTLNGFSSEFRKPLDEKGMDYKRPLTPPRVKPDNIAYFLKHIKDPDSEDTPSKDQFANWLLDAVDNEENLNMIINASEERKSISARIYKIVGYRSIQTALSFELPDSVGATVQIDQRTHRKGGENSPYTWDPNVDHIPSHSDS